ncbi:N-acyl-D-amino-acid deacylase family protein [Ktedonospora formicarum]|uniref:Aminoacylase n=1 Tax=Ktedonospora formicarum TaxID=2778364 RepID=A0A8J3I002_9CHLR|nr:D-aminoacylase [Ktedonospora formicarum]GHO46296.1 aminoacylase [Ktedonospora formicarum]
MTIGSIETLIRGAQIVDGSGNPWYYGDIAIEGSHIRSIMPPGQISTGAAREVVEAEGLVASPGFIDILSHSHIPLFHDAHDLSKITQGVTTEIMGEGWTPAPVGGHIADSLADLSQREHALAGEWVEKAKDWTRFRHWLEALVRRGVSPNVGSFLGGGTLREYAMGLRMGTPTPDELSTMRRVMAEAMEDGAFGVSYALIYPPDTYTTTDELIEVAKIASRYGGIYISHLRSEGAQLLDAIEEAIAIGKAANLPVEIYHLKASGSQNWFRMEEAIKRIQQARDSGLDVTADMYPYVGSGTGLTSILPPWLAEGGSLYERLNDSAIRDKVRAEVLNPSGDWEAMAHGIGAEGVMPIGFERPENQIYVGRRLSEIAAMRGQHWIDATFDLLVSEQQRIFTIYFSMDENNVKQGLRQPWVTISTDAGGVDPAWAKTELGPTHPRAYGTYPRVLGKYVREERLFSLEEAVRKMTGAVATRLRLRERGLLRPGYYADIVLFDPQIISDRATFADAHQLSTGVHHVWVNGTRVIAQGQHTGATPGQFVKGPGTHNSKNM